MLYCQMQYDIKSTSMYGVYSASFKSHVLISMERDSFTMFIGLNNPKTFLYVYLLCL